MGATHLLRGLGVGLRVVDRLGRLNGRLGLSRQWPRQAVALRGGDPQGIGDGERNDPPKRWTSSRRQSDLANVLRRPVELATRTGHRKKIELTYES